MLKALRRATAITDAALLCLFATQPTQASVPTQDSVTGSGTANNGSASFSINAVSGPSGQNPSGTVYITTGIGTLNGSVTCLDVSGSQAAIGVLADSTTTAEAPGSAFLVTVQDNAVSGTPDLIRVQTNTYSCDLIDLTFASRVSSGDIAVVDAPDPVALTNTLTKAVQNSGLDKNVASQLLSTLSDVTSALAQSPVDTGKACNGLTDFASYVTKWAGGKIPQATADDWLKQASLIRQSISC
ncbi:hypothetical protein [Sinomonas gamaensis]|uniref:hypothetical protein n=1 Tax=Sinomonas gamaensis TaxID=2565624 RepID=UPI00110897B6|nr:hypothetical protein [Sinomonas gamaensis]